MDNFSNLDELKCALRNVLALSLQRDRNALSLFSTTKSGYVAHSLLKTPEYRQFAQLILGRAVDDHNIRYRDLRMFVLAENNKSYFYTKYRDTNYSMFESKEQSNGQKQITSNLVMNYLTRHR